MSKIIEKPRRQKQPSDEQADAYVAAGSGVDQSARSVSVKEETQKTVKMARLTVDLPSDEHLAFKVACTKMRTKMNDEIRRFITRRIAELEQAAG